MFIEQTSLIKYFPFLNKAKIGILRKRKCNSDIKSLYSLEIGRNKLVKIKETHCFDCGSRLVKNGRNKRLIIRDNGKGKFQFYTMKIKKSLYGSFIKYMQFKINNLTKKNDENEKNTPENLCYECYGPYARKWSLEHRRTDYYKSL